MNEDPNERFVDFIFTGPPSIDVGAMVDVIDQDGNKVEAGAWHHDGAFWRYRVPVELVPRMVVPMGQIARHFSETPKLKDEVFAGEPLNAAQQKRRELKEKVMAEKQKESIVGADWIKCPNCEKKYDPRTDDTIECVQCSEPRCTAICLPNIAAPCLDCQALNATDEENGRDAGPSPNTAGAAPLPQISSGDLFSQRLFDNKPAQPVNGSAADDGDQDGEGDDE
jgi:hypothetical protein